jgi:4-amino-4-deoxy-L-arabinose transferase-like glycosyltransferase
MTRRETIGFGLLVAAVIYACFFHGLTNLGLVGPDEPRYAAVAMEMLESGDWVTPRLWSRPWFEKPPLYYWAAASRFQMLGVSEFTARVPSVQTATLLTLALGWLAWRVYGAGTARAVLLMFPTCVGVFGFARAATTDMMFSAFLGLAMICAAVLVECAAGTKPRRYWLLLFGATLGMATLAKGPAAVVLTAGSAGLWALATRRWKAAFRLVRPEAVLVFFAVAAPWYALCALRHADFVETFLISHNIERYLTGVFRHEQPFWFYGPILLIGLVPWTPLLAGTLRDAIVRLRDAAWRESPGLFFACWVLFPLLFFSLSKSKLPGYILPVFPALVLLLARSVTRPAEGKRESSSGLLAAVGVTVAALAFSAGFWTRKLPDGASIPAAGTWILLLAVCGGVIAAMGLAGRSRPAQAATAVLVAAAVFGVSQFVLPQLDAHLSPRAAARALEAEQKPGESVAVLGLHRAWHYGANFYLGRELPVWSPDSVPGEWLVLAGPRGLAELRRQSIPYLVVREISAQAALIRVTSRGISF